MLSIEGQKKLCLPETVMFKCSTTGCIALKSWWLFELCTNYYIYCYPDCTHRHFPVSSEQTKLRAANKAEMELNETWEMSDQEGSPSAEEHLNQSFNKYRLKLSVS